MNEPRHSSSVKTNLLLNTKLMPPRQRAAIIERKGLLERLDAGLAKKLILVAAPTGFGKTTLVGMWIANREFLSAWVTLDENDNDPTRFWTYIVSSLRAVDPSIGKASLSVLVSPQPPSFEALLTPLINELTLLKEDCVLVLEDYHAIRSDLINQGVAFLIQHLPESLHVVMVTRSSPDLPLGILRVRDEMIEINAADLRFSQKETEEFLHQSFRAELPSGAVAKLLEQTEGWVGGLRLVAMSLQNKGRADIGKLIESFSGSDHYVADYLIKEVFESQPEMRQTFLMKTCFLRRLTGSLCDAVTDAADGAAMLEGLDRENMFLVQLEHGGERVWYRYSPLFAESLQYLAKQRLDEASLKELFEKASLWYEKYGLFDEAIESALSAKSFERAMLLIEMYIEIHDLTEMGTLGRWLEPIPAELILDNPEICLTFAQVILYSSDRFAITTAARIEPLLDAAEQAWRSEGNVARVGAVSALRGMVALWQGDFQKSFEYVHRSLEELPEYDVFWRGVSLLNAGFEALDAGKLLDAQGIILEAKALLGASQNIHGVLAANQMLGEIFFWQGDMEQSIEMDQQIIAQAVGDEAMLDDQGTAHLNLAKAAYERNDLESAGQFALRALELAIQRANERLQVETTIQLAYIHAAKDEFAQAAALLKSLTGKIQNPLLLPSIQETEAHLAILVDEGLLPAGWVSRVTGSERNVNSLQKEREVFTLARVQIAQGKANEALQALQGWAAEAVAQGRVRSQVEALCIEALAQHASNDLSQATQLLSEALMIGHAKGFRRLILDEGPRMAALLQAAIPLLSDRALSLYATTLLHSFTHTGAPGKPGSTLIEPLSQQELRVLRLLAAGLSNADIARELVVSTNTIKTQVKSIYRKLSINSREEARQVGRELNLL